MNKEQKEVLKLIEELPTVLRNKASEYLTCLVDHEYEDIEICKLMKEYINKLKEEV